MNVDLRDGLSQEWAALKNCFRLTVGNSDVEKVLLWVGVPVAALLVLGNAFGFVNYEELAPPTKMLLDAFVMAVLFLFGRIHGREVERSKQEKP